MQFLFHLAKLLIYLISLNNNTSTQGDSLSKCGKIFLFI